MCFLCVFPFAWRGVSSGKRTPRQDGARSLALRMRRPIALSLLLVSTAALRLPAGRRGSARMCASDEADSYWKGKTCLITGARSKEHYSP